MNSTPSENPCLRYRGGARHHLWRKAGRYYCRYSVGAPGPFKSQRRVCVSLRTTDLAAAQRRRDEVLRVLGGLAP